MPRLPPGFVRVAGTPVSPAQLSFIERGARLGLPSSRIVRDLRRVGMFLPGTVVSELRRQVVNEIRAERVLPRGWSRAGGTSVDPQKRLIVERGVREGLTLSQIQDLARSVGMPIRRAAIVQIRRELLGARELAQRAAQLPSNARLPREMYVRTFERFPERFRAILGVRVRDVATGDVWTEFVRVHTSEQVSGLMYQVLGAEQVSMRLSTYNVNAVIEDVEIIDLREGIAE